MRTRIVNRDHAHTPYITLNTHECEACWECIDCCPNHVIGKINLPWHKHAVIVSPDSCTGCLKCVKRCPAQALTRNGVNQPSKLSHPRGLRSRFIINNLLLLMAIATIVTGVTIQTAFHMGSHQPSHHGRTETMTSNLSYETQRGFDSMKEVWGISYHGWSLLHKVSIVALSLLMVLHFYYHWDWYRNLFRQRKASRTIQPLILTILFLIVALTGIIPWIIDSTGGSASLRFMLIEIHDKVTLLLILFLLFHMLQKIQWFSSASRKLN